MRSSDWSSDVCSSDLIDLTTLETVDRPIVDVDMEPGERSRSFAHDAAERHALPTEPEHLRQPGQLGNAGVVGDPRPQRVLGECGDEQSVIDALWALTWAGRVTNDTFAPIRTLVDRKRTRLNSSH